jgi:hypothetical protein
MSRFINPREAIVFISSEILLSVLDEHKSGQSKASGIEPTLLDDPFGQ